MQVMITGSQSYMGTVVAQELSAAGHEVNGFDTGLFAGCVLGAGTPEPRHSRPISATSPPRTSRDSTQ